MPFYRDIITLDKVIKQGETDLEREYNDFQLYRLVTLALVGHKIKRNVIRPNTI